MYKSSVFRNNRRVGAGITITGCTTTASRNAGNNKCPYCANQAVLACYNDLKTMFPALLNEWDYTRNDINPESFTAFSHARVWWKCRRGHSWRSAISDRNNGNKCLTCVGRRSVRLRLVK